MYTSRSRPRKYIYSKWMVNILAGEKPESPQIYRAYGL